MVSNSGMDRSRIHPGNGARTNIRNPSDDVRRKTSVFHPFEINVEYGIFY
ncbi:MAG: hypothetical protein H6Q30_470 [Bacteroidetes bacterium]|nr:hypothetical protein [Bacteroidota bacterium]